MLSLELCKKLKEAEFPQFYHTVMSPVGKNRIVFLVNANMKTTLEYAGELLYAQNDTNYHFMGCRIDYNREIFVIPDLSELIEAVEIFNNELRFELKKEDGRWHVFPCLGKCQTFQTPEEAVAQLYLNLKEKK